MAEPINASPVRLARAWHAVLAAVIVVALIVQVTLTASGVGSQVSLATRLVRLFSYFTIQSNILVAVAAISLVMDPARDGKWWRVLRLDGLLGIATTGLVFHIVLAPISKATGLARLASDGFHYVSPWMALVGWLLFGPRPRIGWSTVALSLIWPAAWLAYTFMHGALSGWYPYPFLNAAQIGYPAALANTAAVLAGSSVLVLLFKSLDRWVPAPLLSMRRWRAVDEGNANA
ncbi:Pr6Pr family membrane protein [Ralstonia sp. ASV6]|uniref:Pr6Pr family membrane protein n=1 Tax=Ralstonia sp. ASV6 TaxID=2795124 RepID=UPI0018EC7A28|nr:Pr6Pr family membrane protein [Ralstonia sp. ASV6]